MNMSADERAIRRTRFTFFGIILYLASQFFLIPVFALPVNWSLWPRLSDFAFLAILLAYLLGGASPKFRTADHKRLMALLLLVLVAHVISALAFFAIAGMGVGIKDAAYAIYRLTQFLILFFIITAVPLNAGRLKALNSLTALVLILVNLGVILTYFRIIPLGMLTAQLPREAEISGAWSKYYYL